MRSDRCRISLIHLRDFSKSKVKTKYICCAVCHEYWYFLATSVIIMLWTFTEKMKCREVGQSSLLWTGTCSSRKASSSKDPEIHGEMVPFVKGAMLREIRTPAEILWWRRTCLQMMRNQVIMTLQTNNLLSPDQFNCAWFWKSTCCVFGASWQWEPTK